MMSIGAPQAIPKSLEDERSLFLVGGRGGYFMKHCARWTPCFAAKAMPFRWSEKASLFALAKVKTSGVYSCGRREGNLFVASLTFDSKSLTLSTTFLLHKSIQMSSNLHIKRNNVHVTVQ
jgi:hypothetical protein